MENDRLKQQIDAGAMAQPVEEDSMKGLTAQGNHIAMMKMQWLATYNNFFHSFVV